MPEPVEQLTASRPAYSWRGAGNHPDGLRRQTLLLNSVIAAVLSALLLPVSIGLVTAGTVLPVIVNLFTLGVAVVCVGLHRTGRIEPVAGLHVACLLVVGTVFSLVHPNFADFGLATVLLAPIYAGYVAKLQLKRAAWGASTLILGFIVVAHFLLPRLSPSISELWAEWVSVTVFLIAGLLVTLTGWRLNEAFSRFERSQIRAFQHLVENVQDAVVRYSGAGEMLFISRSAEALFGCRRYQLAGSGLLERVHVLDRPSFLRALDEARHDGFARVVEIRVRSDLEDASSFFWIEVSLSPIQDPRSRAPGYEVIAILRDVTVRKDYETEIRRAHQAAEAASQTKSRFLATIGHELRTPLNAVVGFTEMMLNQIGGKLTPEHEEYAGLILQSGQHLLDMITMLLDMSKIEAGKFELHAERFNPAGLVDPCVAMMDRPAREREVTIERDISADLPMIVGDERTCRQVVINLLSNAIKFSPRGASVTLAIRTVGTKVAISVADHGIGMAPEDVARIGEPFFQANSGLDRKYEGAGLGLSIVRGLVDLHDGELKVKSKPGMGTTITVLLPIDGPAPRDQWSPLGPDSSTSPDAAGAERAVVSKTA